MLSRIHSDRHNVQNNNGKFTWGAKHPAVVLKHFCICSIFRMRFYVRTKLRLVSLITVVIESYVPYIHLNSIFVRGEGDACKLI